MSAEEKVFSIPELRLYILKYLIYPNKCFKCGYIPNKIIKYPKNRVFFCEWCNPYSYQWDYKSMDVKWIKRINKIIY